MSVSNSGKQGDAKGRGKFSSFNINVVYQGKDTNPKKDSGGHRSFGHGLQTLGKLPPSRRAPPPCLLPSLKSQTGNNDPNVNLVPPGGAGWGSGGGGQNGSEVAGQRGDDSSVGGSGPGAASSSLSTGPPARDRNQPWGGGAGVGQGSVDPMAPSYMGGKDLTQQQQQHQPHQQSSSQRPQPQKSWRGPAGAGALKNPDLSQAPAGTLLFASAAAAGPAAASSTSTGSSAAPTATPAAPTGGGGNARHAETRPQHAVSKRQQSVLKTELDEITKDDMVATGWALAHNDELDYSAKIVFSDDEDDERGGGADRRE
uniref:BAT2_N domain-containing protein n=1 Tax=Macrostomum lignano TaxID=282301 RepID=A0A1I8GTR8_9PLAT